MNKTQNALKLALSTLANARDWIGNAPEGRWDEDEMYDELCNMVKFVSEALADSALDRMAENARELGLDYEPPCKTGSQCTSKCQQCEQPAQQPHCNDCGGFDPDCPLAQPTQGCEFCSHPLYAGTKCKNCGREQPAQQEPVARLQWIVNHGWILTLLSTAESLAPDIYPLFMKPQDSVIDDAFERGRQQGMKQERALWGLAKNRQEIEEDKYSAHYDGKNWHCVKQSEKQEQMAITNAMAFAFHRAINDGDLPASDLEQIKHGLAAAFANTSPPAQQHDCSRSHPHENMDAMCKLRTEIARLTNENARLKARHQDDEINTYRMTLLCIRDGLQQGMSKSIQKLQAREINDVLGLPSFASYRTSPPASKPWVGLTDEEQLKLAHDSVGKTRHWLVWHVEDKLREKNT